jgi:hypothetical protein
MLNFQRQPPCSFKFLTQIKSVQDCGRRLHRPLLGGAQFNSALQSSFHRVRRILSLFTYALHVSAEAVNRVASCGRAQKD